MCEIQVEEVKGDLEPGDEGWDAFAKPVLREVGVVRVEPRQASAVMRALGERMPLEAHGLDHLKRIKKKDGELWCLAGPMAACEDGLQGVPVASAPFAVWVPVAEARTADEFTNGAAVWPMARIVRDAPASPTAAEVAGLVRAFAPDVEGAHTDPNRPACAAGAGVLVDPARSRALVSATGGATRSKPLDHAPMACIDRNARRQRDDPNRPAAEYLCTGYDLVLTDEPCVMCAMALVHARVRRVAYARPDPRHGGLGSTARVHALRSINHRYRVWTWHRPATPNDAPVL